MPRTKQNNPKNLKGEFAPRFMLLCSAFSCQLVNLLIRMSGEELITTFCWYKMCFWLKMVIISFLHVLKCGLVDLDESWWSLS